MKHLFIIGGQRCGSTYLYHMLNSHPQVVMAQPVRPEPKFFLQDDQYVKGRTFYESNYFTDYPAETCYLGEKSTSYIESLMAAKRIRNFYPDARILVILRNPVLRAWSNYRFTAQHGIEPLDFTMALAEETQRLHDTSFVSSVNPYAYQRRGGYIDYIEDYLKVFDAPQISILIFEEIVGNKEGIQDLYHWLGIDDTYLPEVLGEIFNSADTGEVIPVAAFRSLALHYQQSIERLEQYLHRSIDIWHRHWELL